jgi:hypothetical protein
MDRSWRLGQALRKRFALGLLVLVLACGVRVGWDAARLWAFGSQATIPLAAKPVAPSETQKSALALQPVEFDGAAALELQMPAALRQAVRGELEPWVLAWRVPIPNFRLDQLARTTVRPLDPNELQEFDGNAQGQDLRLLYLCLPGMDPLKLADPYLDLELSQSGDHVVARRTGSPGVALIDLAKKTRQRALPAPAFGRFDGARWVDATRLLVLASERIEANPFAGGPVLYLVDLERSTVTRYAGPSAPFDEFVAVRRELDRKMKVGNRSIVFASI